MKTYVLELSQFQTEGWNNERGWASDSAAYRIGIRQRAYDLMLEHDCDQYMIVSSGKKVIFTGKD
jgi:hypothetical protein